MTPRLQLCVRQAADDPAHRIAAPTVVTNAVPALLFVVSAGTWLPTTTTSSPSGTEWMV